MKLGDAVKRLRYLEQRLEASRLEAQRIQEAMRHAQAVGVWTDCVERAFERELAAVNRRLETARAQLRRLREVEVDSELLEDAYQGRRP